MGHHLRRVAFTFCVLLQLAAICCAQSNALKSDLARTLHRKNPPVSPSTQQSSSLLNAMIKKAKSAESTTVVPVQATEPIQKGGNEVKISPLAAALLANSARDKTAVIQAAGEPGKEKVAKQESVASKSTNSNQDSRTPKASSLASSTSTTAPVVRNRYVNNPPTSNLPPATHTVNTPANGMQSPAIATQKAVKPVTNAPASQLSGTEKADGLAAIAEPIRVENKASTPMPANHQIPVSQQSNAHVQASNRISETHSNPIKTSLVSAVELAPSFADPLDPRATATPVVSATNSIAKPVIGDAVVSNPVQENSTVQQSPDQPWFGSEFAIVGGMDSVPTVPARLPETKLAETKLAETKLPDAKLVETRSTDVQTKLSSIQSAPLNSDPIASFTKIDGIELMPLKANSTETNADSPELSSVMDQLTQTNTAEPQASDSTTFVLRAPELKRQPQPNIDIIPFSKLVSSDKPLSIDQTYTTEGMIGPLPNAADIVSKLNMDKDLRGEAALPVSMVRTTADLSGYGPEWMSQSYAWVAPTFHHKPLYFEQPNLERYGMGTKRCLQPLASGAHFFGSIGLMPYKFLTQHPHEKVYTLGNNRPGDRVPYQGRSFLGQSYLGEIHRYYEPDSGYQ